MAALLTLVWGVVIIAQTARHVLWLDEGQAWLIASGADSVSALLHNMRYEGHPPLWHALLFVASRFSTSPLMLQAVGAACAIGFFGVLFFRAPFSTPEKLLLASGYFFVFEYAVFARCYGLGMLVGAAAAASLAARDRPRAWGVWLGLLANTSFFGWLVAATMLADRLLARRDERRHLVKQCAAFVVLALVAVVVMAPASDINVESRAARAFDVRPLLGNAMVIARAWLAPVPPLDEHFWTGLHTTPAAVVVLLAGALMLALGPPQRHRFFVAAVFVFTVCFGYFVYGVYLRHVGTLWLLTLMLLWVARADRVPGRAQRLALWVVGAVHVLGAAVAIPQHAATPMSRSAEVARWIDEHVDASTVLLAEDDRAVVAVSAYLGGRPITHMSCMEPRTFIQWNGARRPVPPDFLQLNAAPLREDFAEALLLLAADRGARVVLAPDSVPQVALRRVASFEAGVLTHEQVFVYVFEDSALARRLLP